MAPGRVERAEDVVSEGQEVKVRVTDVTPEGKVGLSMLFGADINPESEGRPSFGRAQGEPSGGGFRPRSGGFGRSSGERRPFGDRPRSGGFGDRPRFGGGERRGFSSERRGGFDRPARRSFNESGNRGGGGRDRGGRGGFNR